MLRTDFGDAWLRRCSARSTKACSRNAGSLANKQSLVTHRRKWTEGCVAVARRGSPHHVPCHCFCWRHGGSSCSLRAGNDELRRSSGRDAWKADHDFSRRLGDEWLGRAATALARVPSAIIPNTENFILHPPHAEAQRIQIVESTRARLDPRLLKHLRV